MLPGKFQGKDLAIHELREAAGQFQLGKISAEEFKEMEDNICLRQVPALCWELPILCLVWLRF